MTNETKTRKIFLFMMISLDGFFEGENHDLSWHNVDEEFNDFAIRQLQESDLLIFGHRTYDMMSSFWPSDDTVEDDPEVAGLMNETNKIVFSSSLTKADWNNTSVEHDIQILRGLCQQPGKEIAVLGSSNLCVSLLEAGLLDELRIMVNPVVIGKGTALFAGSKKPLNLQRTAIRDFASGNVLLTYNV